MPTQPRMHGSPGKRTVRDRFDCSGIPCRRRLSAHWLCSQKAIITRQGTEGPQVCQFKPTLASSNIVSPRELPTLGENAVVIQPVSRQFAKAAALATLCHFARSDSIKRANSRGEL